MLTKAAFISLKIQFVKYYSNLKELFSIYIYIYTYIYIYIYIYIKQLF